MVLFRLLAVTLIVGLVVPAGQAQDAATSLRRLEEQQARGQQLPRGARKRLAQHRIDEHRHPRVKQGAVGAAVQVISASRQQSAASTQGASASPLDTGFERGIPDGWTQVSAKGAGRWQPTDERARGDFAAFFDDTPDAQASWLVSPPVTVEGPSDPVLQFYENVNFSSFAGVHEVLVAPASAYAGKPESTDWTVLRSAIGLEDQWTGRAISLSDFDGETIRVAFHYEGDFATEWYIDDVAITEQPAVPACPKLTVPEEGPAVPYPTVPLRWTAAEGGGPVDGYRLHLGTDDPPSNAADGANVGAQTTAYLLDAHPATTYRAAVTAYGPGGGSSDCPVHPFTTASRPVLFAPYVQHFDDYDLDEDGARPDYWEDDPNGITGETWRFSRRAAYGPAHDHTNGAGYFAFLDDSPPHDAPAALRLPVLDLSASSNPRLSFWLAGGTSGKDTSALHVDVSRDGGASFTRDVASVSPRVAGWRFVTVDVSAYRAGRVQIRFRGEETEGARSDLALDDVRIAEAPDHAALSVARSPQTLPPVFIGVTDSAARVQAFTVTNTGTSTATLRDVQLAGVMPQGTLTLRDTASYPVRLVPGAQHTVSVSAAGVQTAGDYSATLVVNSESATLRQNFQAILRNASFGGGTVEQGGYYFANSTQHAAPAPAKPSFNWIEQPGDATSFLDQLGDDDVVGPFEIGFPFQFFGVSYDQFWVSSNGWISFEDPLRSAYQNEAIPAQSAPNNLAAWFWDDLDPSASSVSGTQAYFGHPNDSALVVSFERYPQRARGAAGWITAQIVLQRNARSDSDDSVLFQYRDHGEDLDRSNATVGLENADGTEGVQYRRGRAGGPIFSSPLTVAFGPDREALPVELLDFSAVVEAGDVILRWRTASEGSNDGFEIEWHKEGMPEWKKLGFRKENGTPRLARRYQFRATGLPLGLHHFRLKQIGRDGTVSYSTSIEAKIRVQGTHHVAAPHPNPFSDRLTFGLTVARTQHVGVSLYDALGRRVRTIYDGAMKAETPRSFTVEAATLPSGLYFVRMRGEQFAATQSVALVR